jgi:hypothetical protein
MMKPIVLIVFLSIVILPVLTCRPNRNKFDELEIIAPGGADPTDFTAIRRPGTPGRCIQQWGTKAGDWLALITSPDRRLTVHA